MRASEFIDHIKDMIKEYGDLPVFTYSSDGEYSYGDPKLTFPYYTGSGPICFIVAPKSIPETDNKDQDDGN